MAAVGIIFNEQEERVVRLALRLYGFGKYGAFSIFNDGPGTDGSLAISNYYNPLVRAVKLQRAVSFEYRSSKLKTQPMAHWQSRITTTHLFEPSNCNVQ